MSLSNDEFLKRLGALFEKQKDKGTVFITQKRFTYVPEAGPSSATGGAEADVEMAEPAGDEEEKEYPVFFRATDGESKKEMKVKISTIVQPADFDAFLLSYHAVLRSSFSAGLRPKRKKTTSAKAAAAAAKRKAKAGGAASAGVVEAKGVFTPRLPKVVGPRRGNGVKKRRRLIKRREKAVERWKAAKNRRAAASAAE
ncbi:hypothetical protein JCM10213v2_002327 [Rhodosporidiobolus nylandii]